MLMRPNEGRNSCPGEGWFRVNISLHLILTAVTKLTYFYALLAVGLGLPHPYRQVRRHLRPNHGPRVALHSSLRRRSQVSYHFELLKATTVSTEFSVQLKSNLLVKYNGRLKPCKIKIEGAWQSRKGTGKAMPSPGVA